MNNKPREISQVSREKESSFLPPAPKNKGEIADRLLQDQLRLSIKADKAAADGQEEKAHQFLSEADIAGRKVDHLSNIGQAHVIEMANLFNVGEEVFQKNDDELTRPEKDVIEFAINEAQKMPISLVAIKTKKYRPLLEQQFLDTNKKMGVKELGLSQKRDLLALDQLIKTLDLYSGNKKSHQ